MLIDEVIALILQVTRMWANQFPAILDIACPWELCVKNLPVLLLRCVLVWFCLDLF